MPPLNTAGASPCDRCRQPRGMIPTNPDREPGPRNRRTEVADPDEPVNANPAEPVRELGRSGRELSRTNRFAKRFATPSEPVPEFERISSRTGPSVGFVAILPRGSPALPTRPGDQRVHARYLEWVKRMPSLTSKPWGVNLTILREFSDAEKYLNAIIESPVI